MCGIVGVIGGQEAAGVLVGALSRLEYRGYDSAGIATLVNGHIERRRAEGKLSNLAAVLEHEPLRGRTGIGHTRWATHGAPTTRNAHPHGTARVSIVHNGIIENHAELRAELEAQGAEFETETDTETFARLVDHYLARGESPEDAFSGALKRVLAEVRRGDAVLAPEGSGLDIPLAVLERSLALRLPAVFATALWVGHGGLVSYGPDSYAEGLQAASLFYISKVLEMKGTNAYVSGAAEAGMSALGMGLRAIRRGEAEVVVVGGFDDATSWWNQSKYQDWGLLQHGQDQPHPFAAEGAGTVLGAASYGRPQLVVPLFADQWENGVAVDDAGCGIVLGPDRRGVEDFEQALRTVLAGSSHREAAHRVADEIAAMPNGTDLAPEVEALVETGGG